jgi:cytochrome c peroxidase
MRTAILLLTAVMALLLVSAPALAVHPAEPHEWSDAEKDVLRSLWIESLPEPPVDPSNKYSGDPEAARLGEKFFFDRRFSADGTVSCSTCHRPDMQFTDSLPLAHGMGETARRSMPLLGMAYQVWFFWDGRVDSLWSQALAPPEAPLEHGISRTRCAQIIANNYRDEYEKVFGALPDFNEKDYPAIAKPSPTEPEAYAAWQSMEPEMRDNVTRVFVNMGKAIAAYVRLIVPGESRFDRYVGAVLDGDAEMARRVYGAEEAAGLRLFIGKAKCINCHTGPMITNGDFHNLEIPPREGADEDRGRADGMREVFRGLFNCLSKYSDADPEMDCNELRYMDTDTVKYINAFKVPTLRNVADRPPYMHAGQFESLGEVLRFYRTSNNPELGHAELTDEELKQLEAFMYTLSGTIEVLEPQE